MSVYSRVNMPKHVKEWATEMGALFYEGGNTWFQNIKIVPDTSKVYVLFSLFSSEPVRNDISGSITGYSDSFGVVIAMHDTIQTTYDEKQDGIIIPLRDMAEEFDASLFGPCQSGITILSTKITELVNKEMGNFTGVSLEYVTRWTI